MFRNRKLQVWALAASCLCASAALLEVPGAEAKHQTRLMYAAMGDSYSAGLGTQSFRIYDKTCERTDSAWPHLLSQQVQSLQPFSSVACSGAKIDDLFGPYRGEPSQLERVGYSEPAVFTVTIGGNDAGFSNALVNCYSHNCTGALLNAEQKIARLGGPLEKAFRRIEFSKISPKIFAVGYPQLFPSRKADVVNCGWLSDSERTTLNQLAAQLDATEKRAAENAGISYVSVLTALKDHELCTRNSWVFALRPTCVRDARCGHPLKAGQIALAAAVRRAIAPSIDGQLPGYSRWPTSRHDNPPDISRGPASLIDKVWSSCSKLYCIIGDTQNVVHVFELAPGGIPWEIDAVKADAYDPWLRLDHDWLGRFEISRLLAPEG